MCLFSAANRRFPDCETRLVEPPAIRNKENRLNIEFVATAHFSTAQQEALTQLGAMVYPREANATLPDRLVSWATPQWSILVWEQGELVSHVGLVVRSIESEGTIKQIGGIGGVLTHPAKRGQGLASLAMREAVKHFATDWSLAFALLFCRPSLVPFYQRLAWQPFQGKVYVEQPQGKVEFLVNGAMVLDGKEQAPLKGELDLNGLPW